MSVPKRKRAEGELKVLTKANDLMAYTIKVCSNEKNFPKRYRWCITNRIIDTTAEITDLIIHANSIYAETEEDVQRRIVLIKNAMELTYVLLNQLQLAYQLFRVQPERIEFWTGEIKELQRLLRGWKKGHRL